MAPPPFPQNHSELFNSLGVKVSKEKVKEMFAEVDEDGSGEIDFEEFLVLVAKQVHFNSVLMQFSPSILLRTAQLHDYAVRSLVAGTTGKRQKFRVQCVQCRLWPSWNVLARTCGRNFLKDACHAGGGGGQKGPIH